jgi:hypothetical protein
LIKLKQPDPDMEFRAFRGGGDYVVLLANTANKAKQIAVQFPTPPNEHKLMVLGKNIVVKNGVCDLELAPFQALSLSYSYLAP